MYDKLADLSLGLLKSTDESLSIAKKYADLFKNVTSPSCILDNLPDIKKDIDQMDSRISIGKMKVNTIIDIYKDEINEKKELFYKYQGKVVSILENNTQINLTDSLYDEERLLSKYNYLGFDEDQSHYSIMSIMKRFMSDEEAFLLQLEASVHNSIDIQKYFIDAQHHILAIKGKMNNSEFINVLTNDIMTHDIVDEFGYLHHGFTMIESSLKNAKSLFSELFRRVTMMNSDYEIYGEAIHTFGDVATENMLLQGIVTDIY